MQAFFPSLLKRVEDQLSYVHKTYETKEKLAEEACKFLYAGFARLESFENSYEFRTQEDEIAYFKSLKPTISSKLIYYSRLHRIELEKPNGTLKTKKDYLLQEMDKIQAYVEDNISFISYYKANERYRDHLYFLRNTPSKGHPVSIFREGEKAEAVSYDFKVAKILANDLLLPYLREQLRSLTEPPKPETIVVAPIQKLVWTDSKAALVELIYAMQVTKSLNKGTAEIKDIAELCQRIFNIDLGDYYRSYLAMRVRKTGRTKFLDALREALLAKMDEQDVNLN